MGRQIDSHDEIATVESSIREQVKKDCTWSDVFYTLPAGTISLCNV